MITNQLKLMSKTLKVLVFNRDIKPNENPITDVFEPYRLRGFHLILFPYKDEKIVDIIESGDTPKDTEELISVLRDMLKFEEKEFSIKDDPENVFHVCHVEGMTKKDFYNMFQGDHGHYKIDEHLLTQLEMVAS